MHFKKKYRKRFYIFLLVVLAFVFWRGLRATTSASFNCEYKLIYAVCREKTRNAVLPGIWDIIKAGVKF